MKYTTLLFDLDETLLDFSKAEDRAIRLIMQEYGVPETDENIKNYVKLNKELWLALEKKELTRQQLFERRFKMYFEMVGVVADGQKANDQYVTYISQGHFLIDGALEVVKELSEKYYIYIITNGAKKAQRGRLSNSPLMDYVKDVFISEEIGLVKPSKEYFDYVMEHINEKEKRNVLIIGDSLTSDIAGGVNSGIDTCWINRTGLTSDVPTYEIDNIKNITKIL